MSNVFTESYAAYLFIVIAIILMVCGFIFATKGGKWLFYISAIAWLLGAMYCFSVQGSMTSFIHMLGAIFVIAGLGCAIMPAVAFKTKVEEIKEIDNYTAMADRIERLRGTTERFKARGKDVIL